ncbi:MAG: hypothetical protein ACE5OZ_15305 [Candidatus Heimdallarchaeota archaeon]
MLSGPFKEKTEVLENILSKISSFHLSHLITSWTKTSHTIPDDITSQEKLELIIENVGGVSRSKFQLLLKLEKFLTFTSPWSPFLICNEFHFKQIGLLRRFSTKEYYPNPKAAVRGKLHSFEINPDIFLIVAEFSSPSSLLRSFRRFAITPKLNLLLAEHDSLARKLLTNLIQPTLKLELNNLAINSMVIRDISKDWPLISGLTSLVTTETAGVEGLETVSISGENVLLGAEELKSAKEMISSLMSIGPWVGIRTENFSLNIYEGLKFQRFDLEDLHRLKEILEVED